MALRLKTIMPGRIPPGSTYPTDHWQHRYEEETIAGLLLAEITEGADRNNNDGPIANRSAVKAGIIKIATDYQNILPVTQKLIRATSRIHRETCTPILVHTELGTVAHRTLDLLEAAGVAPDKVLVSWLAGGAA